MLIKVFIVDDDPYFARETKILLGKEYAVDLAFSFQEFYDKFDAYTFDLVLLDLRLGPHEKDKEKGIEILKFIKENSPTSTVIVFTNYPDLETAIRCIRLGASDYLRKESITEELLKKAIAGSLERDSLKRKLKSIEMSVDRENPWELLGNNAGILEAKNSIKLVAEDGQVDVLITGESGTGKELVARNIHHCGKRKNAPMISLNLAAFPKEVLYSHIFGHEKGAYTGAADKKTGSFEMAHKGIIFLDEITEASGEVQISLLRFLETREFQRLGSNRNIKIDIQLLFATNANLQEKTEMNHFRRDLYYRINRFEIHLPPLRDRLEDLEILVDHFLKQLLREGRTHARLIDRDVIEAFQRYSWPGNIRELKNVIEAAAIRAGENTAISLPQIPNHIVNFIETEVGVPKYRKAILEKELEEIEAALKKANYRKGEAAKIIGYNRSHLTRKIKKVFRENPDLLIKYSKLASLY